MQTPQEYLGQRIVTSPTTPEIEAIDVKTADGHDGELDTDAPPPTGMSVKEWIQFITLCWTLFLAGKLYASIAYCILLTMTDPRLQRWHDRAPTSPHSRSLQRQYAVQASLLRYIRRIQSTLSRSIIQLFLVYLSRIAW